MSAHYTQLLRRQQKIHDTTALCEREREKHGARTRIAQGRETTLHRALLGSQRSKLKVGGLSTRASCPQQPKDMRITSRHCAKRVEATRPKRLSLSKSEDATMESRQSVARFSDFGQRSEIPKDRARPRWTHIVGPPRMRLDPLSKSTQVSTERGALAD